MFNQFRYSLYLIWLEKEKWP